MLIPVSMTLNYSRHLQSACKINQERLNPRKQSLIGGESLATLLSRMKISLMSLLTRKINVQLTTSLALNKQMKR